MHNHNINQSDAQASVVGAIALFLYHAFGLVHIQGIWDTIVAAIITLLISFYGNRLLKYIHEKLKKKHRKKAG